MNQTKKTPRRGEPVEIRLRFSAETDAAVRRVQEELSELVPTSRPRAYAALVLRGLEAWEALRESRATTAGRTR